MWQSLICAPPSVFPSHEDCWTEMLRLGSFLMTSNGLFYKKEGNIFSAFRRAASFWLDMKVYYYYRKSSVAVFISWGGNNIFCAILRHGRLSWGRELWALRSWITLDRCELFGAEEIKCPSFWSLRPQQSIFVVDFYWFAGFSLSPSFHISPPDVINVLFEQAAAVTSPSRDD